MKEYTFTPADGMETTVLLSDEDAKARGLTAAAAASKAAKKPANKQAAPANKAAQEEKPSTATHKVDD